MYVMVILQFPAFHENDLEYEYLGKNFMSFTPEFFFSLSVLLVILMKSRQSFLSMSWYSIDIYWSRHKSFLAFYENNLEYGI